jgi:hypothetical protein
MADLTKSAGALIAEVRATVSKDVLESLRPIVRKMVEAAGELERVLGGASTPKAARPGRKPKVQAPKAARAKRTINPRGSMQSAIREALLKAKEGLRLSALRDRVLEDKLFKGRDKLALYNQIAGALKAMPDVVKKADKSYTIGTAAGGTKAAGKTRKTARRKRAKTPKAVGKSSKE